MTASARECCLICGSTSLGQLMSIPGVPTLCNRLCASEAEAANAPRGDIELVYCRDCGHVVNSDFDQAQVRWAFREHADILAALSTICRCNGRPAG
jgi:hypothetical protein